MKKISFTKMVASGNDFVLLERNKLSAIRYPLSAMAKQICDRKFGVGADGLLVLEKSRVADIKMRIFNPDGSEAEMCGNGARCVALYVSPSHQVTKSPVEIEIKAGIIEAKVKTDNVKIKLTEPKDIKLNIPLKINERLLKVNFINTGVPHTVIFVEGLPRSFFLHSVSSKQKGRGLDKIDVVGLGRKIRYHKRFAPSGTNVNFVEIVNRDAIKVRTYERGVEDETLACGTGSVASALLYAIRYTMPAGRQALYATGKVNIHTKSGEILKVYFERLGNNFKNVWLEGKAKRVYEGVYNV